MTVKERAAQLLEALPEEDVEQIVRILEDKMRMAKARLEKPRASAFGKYAHLPGSVDDFLRRKQEEIDLEGEQAARLAR